MVGDFDWSVAKPSPLRCEGHHRLAIGDACVVTLLESNTPVSAWYERAGSLRLESIFSFLDADVEAEVEVGPGWRPVLDPFSSKGEELFARVAVDERAGAAYGTLDSRLREERMELLTLLRVRNELESFEAAAHVLSMVSDCPLPAAVRDLWASRYRCEMGHQIARLLEEKPQCTEVIEVLLREEAIRSLAELLICERARFEVLLLRLGHAGIRSAATALRRAVRDEVRKLRARQRQLPLRVEVVTHHGSIDEHIARFLDALAAFVHENDHRFWRGRQERCTRRDAPGTWLGRRDSPNAPLAIEAEVMRSLLGVHGDPRELLRVLGERGLLQPAPGGGIVWQRRVGRLGRRMSCIAISSAVIGGTCVDGSDADART